MMKLPQRGQAGAVLAPKRPLRQTSLPLPLKLTQLLGDTFKKTKKRAAAQHMFLANVRCMLLCRRIYPPPLSELRKKPKLIRCLRLCRLDKTTIPTHTQVTT